VWADCPKTLLNDLGLGYYAHEDFTAGPTGTLAAALDVNMTSYNGLKFAADTDTDTVVTHKAAEVGGYLDIETDADDNDAFCLHSEPLGTITKNSGKKIWFEIRFELGDVTMDGAFVAGLGEEACQTVDVIANDAAALIGESYVVFRVLNDDANAIDAAYKKDAGTEVEVVADATNSAQITAGGGTVASLVNDTEHKFGIRFDGRETLYFYVDGHKIATQTVDSTIDQSKNYCAIIAMKTGAAAAESAAIDWVRYAVQTAS
jgi:hypothetical protein